MSAIRKTKSSRPSAKVFKTVDIFEQILVHLPCFELFVIQRTSKAFHHAINNSSILQQVLFLSNAPDNEIELNPLLDQTVFIPSEIFGHQDGLYFSKASTSHDDLQNKTLDLFICSETNAWKPWLRRLENSATNASWTKMLISQPPPSNFFTTIHAQPRYCKKVSQTVEKKYEATHGRFMGSGVTLGEVFEELDRGYQRFLEECVKAKRSNRRDLMTGRKGRMWSVQVIHASIAPGEESERENAVLIDGH